MNRCLFTVCSWPGVAAKALEDQGIPGMESCLYCEGSGFSSGPERLK